MNPLETDRALASVLYVDDEEQALKYFRKGLEKDFRVLTASSAAAALTLLEQEAPNVGVVISDQRMPGKCGVAMLTEIRQRWPAMVRILVTAYTDMDSAVAAVNAGAVYKYINKPADFPLLRQVLTEALSMHRETLHRDAMAETLRQLEEQRRATLAAEAQREQLQKRLIDASRQAGRAEVATGILHNVGNVLNSMNVSASVVNNTLEHSRIANLCKGLAMLEGHGANLADFLTRDDQGQRLPSYLAKLAAVLSEEHVAITNAVGSLRKNIDHVANVIRMQQADAREVILSQLTRPADLMDEAIKINEAGAAEHAIQITREYASAPSIMLDHHRVLQILINLVSNAVKAVVDHGGSERRLVASIAENREAETPLIRFVVTDTGAGIESANLTRIFTYGFTTRKEGHGFGLHSAANAAREMGGSLRASSDGPGKGASFVLELPLIEQSDRQEVSIPLKVPA